jgi:hypothetical protein
MTRYAIISISVAALSAPGGTGPSQADDTDKLIGTWKLVSAVSVELATGQKTNIY